VSRRIFSLVRGPRPLDHGRFSSERLTKHLHGSGSGWGSGTSRWDRSRGLSTIRPSSAFQFLQTAFLKFEAAAARAVIIAADLGRRPEVGVLSSYRGRPKRPFWHGGMCLRRWFGRWHRLGVAVDGVVITICLGIEDKFGRAESDCRRRVGSVTRVRMASIAIPARAASVEFPCFIFIIRRAWRRASLDGGRV